MLITRRMGFDPRLAVEDALRMLSRYDWSNAGGGLLAYYPVARGNPFQSLLYSGLRSVGLLPVPTYNLETTLTVAEAVSGSGMHFAVHAHWLNSVLAGADDETTAREQLKRHLEGWRELKDRGARLMWTVHNILPHDTRFPRLEAELRQGTVGAAERVHVMSPRTRELVSPWFEIPKAKLLSIPHPAYHDVYPAGISQDQARAELGLPPDATVFLLFGLIAPYKGLTELLHAFDRLCESEPGRSVLLVAGAPTQDAETKAFCERLRTHPTAHAALRKIPSDEVQIYLRAADIAVLPYRRLLNSGALALALTFGLPVIIRDDCGEVAHTEASYAVQYDASNPDGLMNALAQARSELVDPKARAAALRAAKRVAPDRVAGMYATAVRRWLDGEASTHGL